jgi:hypothetical protein
MEQILPNRETRASESAFERAADSDVRRTQDQAPAYPDPPEPDDQDEDDEAGYPGINRPEMPATDRESIERPEKAPNPLDEP